MRKKQQRKIYPLRHYIDFESYDDEQSEYEEDFVLHELEEKYGHCLEDMTKLERLLLIAMIANDLYVNRCAKGYVHEWIKIKLNPFETMGKISLRLDTEEKECLLEALIDGMEHEK
ncbi:hypothetical protein [Anabaena azotica]|uniref:Uncharacterized protein n=1 Tax=Anabaena azotica FACHB-119 TaxID=947527 RepID=A0ABR8D8B3_9NOST|nr:hypothetical protein [Anabaena azotica]MBD2503433.1 hypothetical protein [Anabaena azotica FACHB-119]